MESVFDMYNAASIITEITQPVSNIR